MIKLIRQLKPNACGCTSWINYISYNYESYGLHCIFGNCGVDTVLVGNIEASIVHHSFSVCVSAVHLFSLLPLQVKLVMQTFICNMLTLQFHSDHITAIDIVYHPRELYPSSLDTFSRPVWLLLPQQTRLLERCVLVWNNNSLLAAGVNWSGNLVTYAMPWVCVQSIKQGVCS